MEIATLCADGLLVIPAKMLEALQWQAGDQITLDLEGEALIARCQKPPHATMIVNEFGRKVLVAPPGAPEMTVELIRELRDDDIAKYLPTDQPYPK